MRKIAINLALSLIGFMVIGCSYDDSKNHTDYTLPENIAELEKYAVENNIFIDVDGDAIHEESMNNLAGNLEPTQAFLREKKLCEIAYQRFSKHVTLVDKIEQIDIKSGAEINISEVLFQCFMKNLEESNEHVREVLRNGGDIIVCDPNSPIIYMVVNENGELVQVDKSPLEGMDVIEIPITVAEAVE